MKTFKSPRKLNLNVETLVPLTDANLHDVNGGVTPTTVATPPLVGATAASVSAIGGAIWSYFRCK